VADSGNNRILFFASGNTTASKVWGQPSFTTCLINRGGSVSASSLNFPLSVVFDASSNMLVSDSNNNRVLLFPANSTVAVKVWGQSSLSGGSINAGLGSTTRTAGTLYQPFGIALDANGRLWVADAYNNRVLRFP
jgi:hypothetical protein